MYIGIDLGTSSVKLLLMKKNGEVVKTVSKDYPLIFVKETWIEQDAEKWFESVILGLKEIIKGYEKDILAISFSGQMHGLVMLDKEDNVIRPVILWCDQRTEKECIYLNEKIGKEFLLENTGNIALTGFTLPKILWVKENEPENFAKISKVMLPKDYIAYKLSGIFATDVSDASGMLVLDVKNRKWSNEMIKLSGLKEENFAKVYESYESIGNIKEEIAKELGLNGNVKIVIGGGDQAVGAVGMGVVNDDYLSVALGTSGVVFANNSEYVHDKDGRLHSFCHASGKYHQMGVILSAASCLKWWVEEINKTSDYKMLVEEAKNSEAKDLYFLPYLVGERTPHNDVNVRGSFIGLNINHKRGDMTRAVLEGVAFALRDSYEILKEMNIKSKIIRLSGGGAKNILWREIICNVFGQETEIVNSLEGPAFGASILSAVGDGAYENVEKACEAIIKPIEKIYPNEKEVQKYNEKYEKFKKLYPMLKEFYN